VVPLPPPSAPTAAFTAAGRAALSLASSPPKIPLEVRVTEDTVWYAVHGKTIEQIAHGLGTASHGSADSDYVGATRATLRWQFAQRRLGDSCVISDIVVSLEVETRLPQWQRPTGVSSELTRQWATFLAATERHENGHRNIALQTAVSIAHALGDEHGLPCAELDQLANASAHVQWDLGNQHQLSYDAATIHGETQGTRWPPFVDESTQ
jgi:predicted secreted Zn-dependent protease